MHDFGDTARATRSDVISRSLSQLSDAELRTAVAAAQPLAAGIGGHTFLLLVGGASVFVKRVPLTDMELRSKRGRPTKPNHLLPAHFHYGVGSVGSSAWRELTAHIWTSDSVLTGRCDGFPLLHHWRVLDHERPATPTADSQQDLLDTVMFWHGDAAVHERLTAMSQASAGLYLFLEYVPQNLADWLAARLAEGPQVLDSVCDEVATSLVGTVAYMSRQGFQYFDAHFRNILTDGRLLYFSDFGLALSDRFDLTSDEAGFLLDHQDHDLAYVVRELVNWLVEAFADDAYSWTDATPRNALVRGYAHGHEAVALPPHAAALVRRFGPVAVVLNDFYWQLHRVSRQTPFPAREVRRTLVASGLAA